jgi:hypothetical protein
MTCLISLGSPELKHETTLAVAPNVFQRGRHNLGSAPAAAGESKEQQRAVPNAGQIVLTGGNAGSEQRNVYGRA